MKRHLYLTAFVALMEIGLWSQPVFRGTEIFPAQEYAERRTKLMTQLEDGVAIMLGATEPPGEMPFRQNSQFFYLTGVVEPRARLIIDGHTRKTTIFLQQQTAKDEQSKYGPGLNPGPESARLLGVEDVLPGADFGKAIAKLAQEHRTIYTPFAAEVLGSQSQGDPTRMWAANRKDEWDGRDSREATFVSKLKQAAPHSKIRDLDPIENALRTVKSPREIDVIREATRITGLGIMEAMRDVKPGMREYELQADAEFVFKKNGAFGPAYFALIGTGKNTYYTHYHRNTAVLADSDLVQFDYAPDYKYYQSDVTRVFPTNGKFTPRQREAYEIYLRLYQALMTSIKPNVTPAQVVKAAVTKMDTIMSTYRFTDPKIRKAAEAMVEKYRSLSETARALGHNVGLEVHDVHVPASKTLVPGQVFTIEPQMRVEDDHLGIRLEDMILITDSGYENLSEFVPIEVKDIEKLMSEKGLSDSMLKLR